MNRQYVIFYWHLFSARDWQRFACDAMIARGYTVQVIELGEALENLKFSDFARSDFTSIAQTSRPADKAAVTRVLDQLTPRDLIVTLVPIQPRYLWLHMELGRRGLRYVQLSLGRLPTRPIWRLLARDDSRSAVAVFFQSFFHLAYRIKFHLKLIAEMGLDYFRIPPPLLWGRAGSWRDPISTEGVHLWRSEVVELESLDVAWARAAENTATNVPDNAFAVYVDESLHDHPDYAITGIPAPVEKESFFPALRRTFDRIEREQGLEVIVALHPKAHYTPQELAQYFGNRQTISAQTPALIQSAALILLHNSTSVTYAVLYRKPILFLTSHDIDKSWLRWDLDVRSYWLSQPVHNIDVGESNNLNAIPKPTVNERRYADFECHFLRSPHARAGTAVEIVADRFEALAP
ncbi:MAG: hypothetical protein ABJ388_03135 [Alphaproteobacteria bacterium]|uniref:hypothetical protein n=1 Tax=Nisaea sp. TaxID=2024842 RepID=UPI0032668F2E